MHCALFAAISLVFAQHRAAAALGAAQTGMIFFGLLRVFLADLQIVIVDQLVARANVAARFDEHSMVFFLDLAIGRAGVIDPTR